MLVLQMHLLSMQLRFWLLLLAILFRRMLHRNLLLLNIGRNLNIFKVQLFYLQRVFGHFALLSFALGTSLIDHLLGLLLLYLSLSI